VRHMNMTDFVRPCIFYLPSSLVLCLQLFLITRASQHKRALIDVLSSFIPWPLRFSCIRHAVERGQRGSKGAGRFVLVKKRALCDPRAASCFALRDLLHRSSSTLLSHFLATQIFRL